MVALAPRGSHCASAAATRPPFDDACPPFGAIYFALSLFVFFLFNIRPACMSSRWSRAVPWQGALQLRLVSPATITAASPAANIASPGSDSLMDLGSGSGDGNLGTSPRLSLPALSPLLSHRTDAAILANYVPKLASELGKARKVLCVAAEQL